MRDRGKKTFFAEALIVILKPSFQKNDILGSFWERLGQSLNNGFASKYSHHEWLTSLACPFVNCQLAQIANVQLDWNKDGWLFKQNKGIRSPKDSTYLAFR